ncbi:adenylate cyclase [Pararhizobium capsulatum DSM 1112]|uniref:Adenylate cyclase n=1 Tax=Pararhizobium capsulatum DSM 1112 TaxID=1121113 RepID=A0ABU0BW99_9HYPH|nr:adenylate/guanylate cyclase domain-containing protein [Pararhizobium capsulatum]MDQ0322528.1 adenylate cyclase [Pararhizobium capsulatum DSM 1112]
MRHISSRQTWLLICLAMAASGIIYGLIAFPSEPPLIGAGFAICMGLPLIAFERGLIFRRLHRQIQRFPTVALFLASIFIYEILMSAGYAVAALGYSLTGVLEPRSIQDIVVMPLSVFLYALGVCSLIIFVLRVRELLGREIFANMLISKYRHPVTEERVFLFVDLVDSTAFAERNGDLRAQQFLGELFAAFAEPVRRHKGTIDDYVGDAAIITWPLARGVHKARCVRCIFDILDVIEANSERWLKRFGQVPRLRAALHGGTIITAEIGVDHHKIAYFGDTVNATARLEAMCRTLNRSLLISTELAERIDMPETIAIEDLGSHALRGRGQTIGVMALSRPPKASNIGQRKQLAG